MEVVLALVVFAAVFWFVSAPLRARDGGTPASSDAADGRRADLEAARDAKYAEIRELEMDFRTGKLEEADFEATNGRLRAEAVALLRALDELD